MVGNLIGENPEELTDSKRGLDLARLEGIVVYIWFNTVRVTHDAGARVDKAVTTAAGTTNPGRADTLAKRDPPGRLNKAEVTEGKNNHPTNIHDTRIIYYCRISSFPLISSITCLKLLTVTCCYP